MRDEKLKETRSDEIVGGYPDHTHDFWYQFLDGLKTSTSGERVTATTSQRLAANYACIVALTESISMLPISVIEDLDAKGVTSRKDHYLYNLLRHEPNSYMDSFEFFEMMQGNACEYGDSFAHLQRKKTGAITQITPLPSELVEVKVLPDNKLGYVYNDFDNSQKVLYDSSSIFHFKPHTRNGIRGRTPIKVAADVLGLGLALQSHGSHFFKNGAFLSGLLRYPVPFVDDEARKSFVDSFKTVMGSSNAGKIGLLEGGAEYLPFQSKLEEAQYAELMQLSVVDIARLWRMPPMFIQQMDKGMTFASSEQLAIVFTQYTIQPWIVRWERAIKRQLLGIEDSDLYVRFNVSSLLRGDLKSRTEAIVQQMQYGLKTINEGRQMLDENPIDHEVGDEPLLSHNLIPASNVMSVTTQDPPADPQQNSVNPSEIRTKSAFFSQLKRAFSDLSALEVKNIRRCLKKEDAMKQAESYYEKHQKLMRDKLEPVLDALKTAFNRRKSNVLEPFLDVYCADRCGEIAEWITEGGIDEKHGDRWLAAVEKQASLYATLLIEDFFKEEDEDE